MNGVSIRNPMVAGAIALVLVILAAATFAIVPETQQAVILRFGQPIRTPGGEEQIMIRDARLDELLATHRQGGTNALPMPAGFLRSTPFTSSER